MSLGDLMIGLLILPNTSGSRQLLLQRLVFFFYFS